MMDITKEKTQLNKVDQINSSFIRTMAKDMSDLKGEDSLLPNTTPPVNLPISPNPKIKKIKVKSPNIFYRLFKSKSVDIKKKLVPKPLAPPTPPNPLIPPKSIVPKPKPFEIETTEKQIKSTFVFLALVIIVITTSIGGFFYWWNYIKVVHEIIIEEEIKEPIIEELIIIEPIIIEPQSLIPITTTETIELFAGQENLLIGQLGALITQEQEINTFKRVLVKLTNQTETKYADLNTLILALGISIPEPIIVAVTQESDNYTLFFYSQREGNRLGLIIKMGESETLVEDLKGWEITALNDLKSMILMDEIPTPATEGFQDNTHNDVYIRYMNFNTPDLSLDYGLVPGNLVLSTSRESMFSTIDALLSE